MDLVNRYIKVTRENEKEVLKVLEELGFTWSDGFKPTKWSTFNDYNLGDSDIHFIQTIGENKINFCTEEKFLDDYIKNKEFNLAYLKSFCKDEKLEQLKIIRKLKDLDGLENGSGLKVYWCEDDKCLEIYFNSRFIDRVFKLDKTDVLKAMGFKFEYKPLRTEQEVKKEIMNLESLPFTQEKVNYYVDYNNLIGKYLVICDSVNGHGLHIYMIEETAQKYVDELNEIIGGK
ncbi:MAG: hypothetical protein ACRCXT_23075 [Paraclostridium sp.]